MHDPATAETLGAAKERTKELVLGIDGVQGVGIGDGTIRVYVRNADVAASCPETVDGVPVEPVIVGDFTAY